MTRFTSSSSSNHEDWEDLDQSTTTPTLGHEFDSLLQSYEQQADRQAILRVLLIRHGETDYNVQGIIQGQMDTPLNSLGRKQAHLTGTALARTSLDAIYSSPLERTMDTASAIHRLHPSKDTLAVIPDDRLKERGFGSLEGRSFKGKKADHIPGIEKASQLQARVASFWKDLVEREVGETRRQSTSRQVRTVLLVGHGAALSALLEVLTPYTSLIEGVRPSRLWNCSITEMAVLLPVGEKEQGIVITRWADIRHLEVPVTLQETEAASQHANGSSTTSAETHVVEAVSKTANADEIKVDGE